MPKKPNVVYFLVGSLGMGKLSSFNGGSLRGVTTARIDAFAKEGMMLLNFAPETQCTPSRSAPMTGRYSIRSGNQTVALRRIARWPRAVGTDAVTRLQNMHGHAVHVWIWRDRIPTGMVPLP